MAVVKMFFYTGPLSIVIRLISSRKMFYTHIVCRFFWWKYWFRVYNRITYSEEITHQNPASDSKNHNEMPKTLSWCVWNNSFHCYGALSTIVIPFSDLIWRFKLVELWLFVVIETDLWCCFLNCFSVLVSPEDILGALQNNQYQKWARSFDLKFSICW